MATHLGLGQALRVMRSDVSRSGVGNWRKETLVDIVMSLAFTTRAIPGVQEHLEAAHKLALASPAHGGGIDAAIKHLRGVVPRPVSTAAGCLGDEDPNVVAEDSTGGGPPSCSATDDNCGTGIIASDSGPSQSLSKTSQSLSLIWQMLYAQKHVSLPTVASSALKLLVIGITLLPSATLAPAIPGETPIALTGIHGHGHATRETAKRVRTAPTPRSTTTGTGTAAATSKDTTTTTTIMVVQYGSWNKN